MRTIKTRLTILSLSLIAIVLAIAGTYVVNQQRQSLTASLDTSLQTRADDIVALLEQDAVPEVLGINRDEDTFAMVLGPQGQVLTTTDKFGDPNELLGILNTDASEFVTTRLNTFDETFGTDRMRVHARIGPRGETVVVGQSLDTIDQTVSDLRTTLGIVGPILALATAAATSIAVHRALRPVEAMRNEANQISLTGLDRRLPLTGHNDEIGQLSTTFNDMLERLERSAQTQRQLVSDIAHELRSPITAIAIQHQVDLANPHSADWPTTAAEVLEETNRLQLLIDNLLLLARLDNDAAPSSHHLVDLDEIVLTAIDRAESQTQISIDHQALGAGLVRGDPIQLEQVVRNLLDNAIRHAHQRITVSLAEHDDVVELQVSNDGDPISEEHAERIFERFYRIDEARDRDTGGAGLGLAITKELLALHNATISAQSTNATTTFTVILPATSDP